MMSRFYSSVLWLLLLASLVLSRPVQVALLQSPPQDPDASIDILSLLLAKNARWSAQIDEELPHFFNESSKHQAPPVLWIGCADSRVPESVVTDVLPGTIFTTRNIANQVHEHDDSVHSVIEYAVEHLHVQHIIVAGHTNCGGVTAAHAISTETPLPPPTNPLTRWLESLVHLSLSLGLNRLPPAIAVPLLTNASVKAQVENVAHTEAVHEAWEKGVNLQVHGWLYTLETGLLSDLNVSVYPPPHH